MRRREQRGCRPAARVLVGAMVLSASFVRGWADEADRDAGVVTVGGGVVSRSLEYTDDIFGALRDYRLEGAPTLTVRGLWFPGRHVENTWLSSIGVTAHYERAFGIVSERADGEDFATTTSAFGIGLHGVLPLGPHQFSAELGFGGHSFTLEPSGLGSLQVPDVPDVEYRYWRVGTDMLFRLSPSIGWRASYGVKLIRSAGRMSTDWFPHADVGGVDMGTGLIYGFEVARRRLQVELELDLRHYYFDMNSIVGDDAIAGGAIDQYLRYSLQLSSRF